jgi:hypothetical protein
MPLSTSIKPAWLALIGVTFIASCQSASETLNNEQGAAMNAAMRRAQFEMACPTAAGTVLSSNFLQPVQCGGVERAEYTIGVQGCGKRTTYVSICPVASFGTSDCFATAGLINPNIGFRP